MGETSAPAKPQANPIAAISELGEEALALLQPEMHPRAFVDALIQQKLYADAIRFLAHALPKREGIWWAWVSARRAAGTNPPPKIAASLSATEKWIAQPTEEHRRGARDAGERASFQTPAGCVGLAVFFSGGSLAAPGAPEVPPGEYLSAKMVAGAVTVSAVFTEPEKAPEKFQASIAQGLDVTRRIKLWEASA